jgi:hypothetical protein
MNTYLRALQPIFGARFHKPPHADSRVITECSIMQYNKSCLFFLFFRTVFVYDKFRTRFLIKHALTFKNRVSYI